jgi:SAP domain-containing ribonucleoprotein
MIVIAVDPCYLSTLGPNCLHPSIYSLSLSLLLFFFFEVTDLREALAKRGLPSDGLKADLIIRLQARLDEEEFGLVEAPPPSSSGGGSNEGVTEEGGEGGGDATTSVPPSVAPAPQAVVEEETAVAGVPPQKKVEVNANTALKSSASSETVEATTTSMGVKVVVPRATSEMSFKEKLEQRAKRFGITENTGKSTGRSSKNDKIKQQQQQQSGKKREVGTTNKSNNKNQSEKKQKVVVAAAAATTTAPTPLLPKDEIERRLARAAKYGTTEGVDELKAQLRKHRFASLE